MPPLLVVAARYSRRAVDVLLSVSIASLLAVVDLVRGVEPNDHGLLRADERLIAPLEGADEWPQRTAEVEAALGAVLDTGR